MSAEDDEGGVGRGRGGRSADTQFKKGASGNPKGMPRELVDLIKHARLHTREAFDCVLKNMRTSRSVIVRQRAAEFVIERGWGKAPQEIRVKDDRPLVERSDAELAAIIAAGERGEGDSETETDPRKLN